MIGSIDVRRLERVAGGEGLVKSLVQEFFLMVRRCRSRRLLVVRVISVCVAHDNLQRRPQPSARSATIDYTAV
jgi:hypothetical protein